MAQNGAVYGSKRSDKFPPLMLRYDRSPSFSIEHCSVPGNYYDQSCSWSASPLGFYEEPDMADVKEIEDPGRKDGLSTCQAIPHRLKDGIRTLQGFVSDSSSIRC